MIRMQSRELPAEILAELAVLQQEIDNHPTYLERVRAAVESWPSRRRRKVFERVEKELGGMCPGLKRCMFCEDNGAYQIEHFRPKALYPKLVYAWANYLFACGQCNGSKSDRFAIFSANGKILEIVRTDSDPESDPSVLLDPRCDDPMEYLWLDLRDTFRFKPIHPEETPGYDRADLTLDWLGLNERDELVEARRNAYDDYLVRFEKYVAKKRANCDAETLKRLRRSIERSTHITVWREMQRQRQTVDELRALFEEAPEALEWP